MTTFHFQTFRFAGLRSSASIITTWSEDLPPRCFLLGGGEHRGQSVTRLLAFRWVAALSMRGGRFVDPLDLPDQNGATPRKYVDHPDLL